MLGTDKILECSNIATTITIAEKYLEAIFNIE